MKKPYDPKNIEITIGPGEPVMRPQRRIVDRGPDVHTHVVELSPYGLSGGERPGDPVFYKEPREVKGERVLPSLPSQKDAAMETETEDTLARALFGAYNDQGPNPWKTFDGRDVPKWEALSSQVREKWRAAARAAKHLCEAP